MGTWKTLLPPDHPTLQLAAPDNDPLTFEAFVPGHLSASNYNDTYPVFLRAGYSYDVVTVNSGEGTGTRGKGLYGVWTDLIVYNESGDDIAFVRALDPLSVGYNGSKLGITVPADGTYYISE